MSWGTLFLSEEVAGWLSDLSARQRGRVEFHLNRLAELGPGLHAPHARHLGGKLWELRFYLSTSQWRITYTSAPDRHIYVLTVFAKTQQRETLEIERARRALSRTLGETHD
ncbi:MAG: type II toxin-antitoxin system RelE/ParE family toxin [Actinobacteria bacterium]|nr:type II toxin-antitoxin system RelE/ParE family toxin [Actinomycetota bacterium]